MKQLDLGQTTSMIASSSVIAEMLGEPVVLFDRSKP
jgi:hypothetical protein